MSIKTETTTVNFENESGGTRLKLTVEEGSSIASFTLSSVEVSSSFAIRLVDLELFASFFGTVAEETPVPEPVSETEDPEVP